MSETGQRICRLAEEAANATQPRHALRLLCELRRELEDFERRQVARALTAGDSFGAVARSLGVSRQAAHRRFRDLAPSGANGGTERPTPEARLVVEYAREECGALEHEGVGSEHMLLGVLRLGDERAAATLEETGVKIEEARAIVRRRPRSASGRGEGDAPRSGRRLAHAALSAARRHGARSVGVEHLLLGALEDDEGGAAAALRELGVPVRAVRARLEEVAAEAQQPLLT